MLVSKRTYDQVVKNLDHYRKQHELDRKENPTRIPPSWGSAISMMIEDTVRGNHEGFYKELPKLIMEYLVTKGLLVHYVGDYTFPTNERLPTEEEIKKQVKAYFPQSK